MITRVVLKNVRSHLDADFELTPGLNVFAGEGDEGKSNVLRAIYWALDNRSWNPRPFKRLKPGKESRVELHFSDGNVVARIRSAKLNCYELNGERFTNLKLGKVPDEIKKIININKTNLQEQIDTYFLLHLTPGKVAGEISKVAELEEMEAAQTESNTRVKAAIKETTTHSESLTQKRKELQELDWITDFEVRVNKVVEKQKDLDDRKELLSKIKAEVQAVVDTEKALKAFPSEDLGRRLSALSQTLKEWAERQASGEALLSLVESVTTIEEAISNLPSAALAQKLSSLSDQLNEYQKRVGLNVTRIHEVEAVKASELALSELPEAQVMGIRLKELGDRVQRLIERRKGLEQCEGDVQTYIDTKKAFEALSNPNLREAEQRLFNLNSALTTLSNRKEKVADTREDVGTVKRTEDQLALNNVELEEAQEALETVRAGIEICPTCGLERRESHTHE